MRDGVADVYMFEGLRGANAYLLVSEQDLTMIDTGVPGDVDTISDQLSEGGFDLTAVKRIILTHAHGDHIGGCVELVQRSGAQVLAHKIETPYIELDDSLPANSFPQRIMYWTADHIMFRLSACEVDRLLTAGDLIDVLDGLRVIHTPGHTPGSISLYQPARGILFCGDALFNANPITRKPGLTLPLDMVTFDSSEARDSVKQLMKMDIKVLCPGHGKPILDGVREKIQKIM